MSTVNHIIAGEGKVFRRLSDGAIMGNELYLGYTYFIAGVRLDTPLLELPEHYEEIDEPVIQEPNPEPEPEPDPIEEVEDGEEALYVYIKGDSFYPVRKPLPDIYAVGETFEDFKSGLWILLNPDQRLFLEENNEATTEEVFRMQLADKNEPVTSLSEAIEKKLAALHDFDTDESGHGVNNFFVNTMPVWINAEMRAIYRTSVDSAELLGEEAIELELSGMFIPLPIVNAKVMLARVQRYADKSAIVTAKHRQAISELETTEEVEAYDFTPGYPDKENFEISF